MSNSLSLIISGINMNKYSFWIMLHQVYKSIEEYTRFKSCGRFVKEITRSTFVIERFSLNFHENGCGDFSSLTWKFANHQHHKPLRSLMIRPRIWFLKYKQLKITAYNPTRLLNINLQLGINIIQHLLLKVTLIYNLSGIYCVVVQRYKLDVRVAKS